MKIGQLLRDAATGAIKDTVKDAFKALIIWVAVAATSLGAWAKFRTYTLPLWVASFGFLILRLIEWAVVKLLSRVRTASAEPVPEEVKSEESRTDRGREMDLPDGDYFVPVDPFPPGIEPRPGGSYHPSDQEVIHEWGGVNWTTTASAEHITFPDNGPRCLVDDCELAAYKVVKDGNVVDAYWRCDVCRTRYDRTVEHPAITLWRAYRVLESQWRKVWRHKLRGRGYQW